MAASPSVLVINSGSSSVKFAAFDLFRNEPKRTLSGSLERIGLETGRFIVKDRDGQLLIEEKPEIPNHIVALDLLLAWIEEQASESSLIAVGHRVAHGGPRLISAVAVDDGRGIRIDAERGRDFALRINWQHRHWCAFAELHLEWKKLRVRQVAEVANVALFHNP